MKKVLTSLVVIALAAVAIVGTTYALFTDTGDIEGVTFSTGNADLQLTNCSMPRWYDGTVAASTIGVNFPENIYPGYQGSWSSPDACLYLGNFSDSPVDLVVNAKIKNYTEDVNPIDDKVEMAIAWGGNCDNLGNGTGFHTLKWWKNNSEELFRYISGSADPNSCGFIPNDHSSGYQGYAKSIKLMLKIPEDVGNEIANGVASFDLHFDAEQKN